jgi:2-isopropylmalate synthase
MSFDSQTQSDRTRTFGGDGADTDIVVASAKAYLAALNKLLVAKGDHGPAETSTPSPRLKSNQSMDTAK